MEETVFLFCSKKQFMSWKTENCGNCRRESSGFPGCALSEALADALFMEEIVPLNIAERIGYFDTDDEDRLVPSSAWTCREFQEKDLPWTQPCHANGLRQSRQGPGELAGLSPRPVTTE